MGSGASKQQPQSGSGGLRPSGSSAKSINTESDEFQTVCLAVFKKADKNGDGQLDRDEFWSVLQSKTLNLNLSQEEMREIQQLSDTDGDGLISYAEFIPVVKQLLQKVYNKKPTDWNDWCKVTHPQTNQVVYINKRTGAVQKKRPNNYHEERIEEQQFEYITLPDGTECTTYVADDGQRMYMDWDSQTWKPFKDEWYQQGDTIDEEHDPRVGEYQHPTRGTFPTYLFENPRNTRLYFDEALGQWARMPLAWERNIPEIEAMLKEMDRQFPNWKNVNEQLLALRECNYDLQDALVFAEINWAFDNSKKDATSASGISAAVSRRLHSLETQLAEKTAELERLKRETAESEQEKVSALTREKTQVENLMKRKERTTRDTEERLAELSKDNGALRDEVGELQRQLVEFKANKEKLQALEKEVAAHRGSGGEAALKDLAQQLEAMRMENVALKMKLQQAKERLDQPTKSAAARKIFGDLHGRVKELQDEKNTTDRQLRSDVQELQAMFDKAVRLSKELATNVTTQMEDITAKYRQEVLQRKLLYNKVQELRGNIRVFCRCRKDAAVGCVHGFPGPTEIMAKTLQGDQSLVEFDRVFSPNSTQEQVFEDTKPIIMSVVDGYNVCIMAYGQTGSGKTYTMMGTESNPGVNRRAIHELIKTINDTSEIEFTITVSMMEVYNEKIFDLLTGDRSKSLSVHQGPNGVFVADLTEETVSTVDDVLNVMARGDKNRSVGTTQMNTDSSRSHLLLQIKVVGFNKISKVTSTGKLTLVDLAGSERVSKSEASGERLVEAAAINKSLTALGQVFSSIAKNAPHIPFRNSKLTHILQDSLGGDSKTAVFVNIRPDEGNLSETHCTLNFGKNIRKIELGPATKHRSGAMPPPPKRK